MGELQSANAKFEQKQFMLNAENTKLNSTVAQQAIQIQQLELQQNHLKQVIAQQTQDQATYQNFEAQRKEIQSYFEDQLSRLNQAQRAVVDSQAAIEEQKSQTELQILDLTDSLNRKERDLLLQQQKVAKLEATMKQVKGKGAASMVINKSGGLLDFTAEEEMNFL